MKITTNSGKYVFNFDEATGDLTIQRNGQPWRDETGDNAMLSLLQRAVTMEETLQQAREYLAAQPTGGPVLLGLICMIDDALECTDGGGQDGQTQHGT